ncbi:amino acid ABC transporter substrate-binding protein [Paenibacillus aurantius]|uniref:Amino acid ABC transporter substrate-binding protein n=1 Tax=Paenibacillus aurantius TaxID=2918900 RepID=A0AA96LN73_9BACL|nr:amino acid ABC transporter substrate-binding protein [Paenibacillus aurantius]WNQ14237.1 amino acid ABC transporter substrate-binding protein [Paenibacillus aurantius]
MRFLALLLLLTALIGASACSNRSAGPGAPSAAPAGSPGASTNPPAGKNSLDAIKANGKLRVGTEGTYAPFTFHDPSGKLTGFDVELATEIAKRLGVQPQFVETKWDGMLAGLDAGRFDMVANQVSIREDRKVKYDFSNPYISSPAVLIVRSDETAIKTFADLKGKKSGQSLTSNLADIARKNGAELVTVEGFNQAVELLLSRRIDATVNDKLSFLDFKKQKPNAAIKTVDEAGGASESGMLFAKGQKELVDAVNSALAEIKKDGTYAKISQTYFGVADVSK